MNYGLPFAHGNDVNPQLFSMDENPYGVTNSELAGKWWNWFLSFPQDKNPSIRDEDDYCKVGQNNSNVIFLTGANGDKHIRKCTIPEGKSLFFGHGYESSEFENPGVPIEGLADCGLSEIKSGYVGSLEVEIDGVPIKNVTNYGIKSGPFDLYFPEGNIFGVQSGTAKAGAFTYVIFIKSLEPGEHRLNVRTASSPTYPHPSAWEVTYLLKAE